MSIPLHIPEPSRNRQLLIPALAASVNNWAPPSGNSADVWLVSASAGSLQITGIDSNAAPIGALLTLVNVGNTNAIALPYASASSFQKNRFVADTGYGVQLNIGAAVVLRRSDTVAADVAGWQVIAATGLAAGGDLSGFFPAPAVAKINGVALGSTTATDKNILIADGTSWITRAVSGDVTIGNTGVVAIGAAKVTEAMQVLADNTTNNATTSAHGYLKKLDNTATNFMNGTGAWSVPAGGGDWNKISTQTASASGSIDFTGLTSSYAAYKVVFSHVAPASDGVNLLFRTSTDNGSTFAASAGNYAYSSVAVLDADATVTYPLCSTSATSVTLNGVNSLGNAANELSSGELVIFNPSAAKYGHIMWTMRGTNISTSGSTSSGTGVRLAAADIDAIRFLMSSGNLASGIFTLYGQTA